MKTQLLILSVIALCIFMTIGCTTTPVVIKTTHPFYKVGAHPV